MSSHHFCRTVTILGALACSSMSYAASMSERELIDLALSAAPPAVSRDAAVLVPGRDGTLKEVKKGSNGFTCIPDDPATPKADPMCLDSAATEWVMSLMKGEPKPRNVTPGVGYMARGGQHWQKDGKILMKEESGAKLVDEPPHWMIFWPFESKTTALPTLPGSAKSYIMWAGTPYAHLMIYQDPAEVVGD